MYKGLSFDSSRVSLVTSGGVRLVRKKTEEREYQQLIQAQNHLESFCPDVSADGMGSWKIRVAEWVGWDPLKGEIQTRFCDGSNLEELLKTSIGSNREPVIRFLVNLYQTFRNIGFLWGDFAPRNMLLDGVSSTVRLVDFERQLELLPVVGKRKFVRYVREYSREEFASFFTTEEQNVLFGEILEQEDDDLFIPTLHIRSRRKRVLLQSLFGMREQYQIRDVRYVEDLMVHVATPLELEGVYRFPMELLDLIGSIGGSREYAEAVLAANSGGRIESFSELRRRAAALGALSPAALSG